MTVEDARIRAALETGADHVEAVRTWARELAELRDWIAGGSILDLRRALDRAERLTAQLGLAIAPLERAFPTGPDGVSEQTDRIVIVGSETCTRCAGTGEVPIVEPLP
jgi:hypothetical protein